MMPYTKSKRTAFPKLLPKLQEKIEALTADAAADEQLALAALSGKLDDGKFFHNVKVQCQDVCHAVRRLGQRPSFADPFLKEVLNLFFDGPAKMIEHSVLFKENQDQAGQDLAPEG